MTPNRNPGRLPKVNTAAFKCLSDCPHHLKRGLATFEFVVGNRRDSYPASLAKSACDHPNNVLAARTCFGVMECPVIET